MKQTMIIKTPEQMAALVTSWQSPTEEGRQQAFNFATRLALWDGRELFYKQVASIITAQGRNRQARRAGRTQ